MRVLLLVALLATVSAAAAPVHLSAYQSEVHDMSDWRNDLQSRGLETRNTAATPLFLSELADPSQAIFVVAGLERSYSTNEKATIRSFVAAGGTVVFGDNGGSMPNSFSQEYGVLFYGSQLLDTFEFNQSFVRVSVPSWQEMPLFIHPTALLCRSEACQEGTLARSSKDSFLDLNRNGVIDAADDVGPFTLAVRIPHGKGSVLFLPTPAFATNDAIRDAQTSAFLDRMIAEMAPDAKLVVFDESRHVAPQSEAAFVAALTVLGGFVSGWIPRSIVAITFLLAAVVIVRRARRFMPWGHRYAPDQATEPPVEPRSPGHRLADLLRMKIKLDHQLVEPVEEATYLEHAPDDESRKVLRHPGGIDHEMVQRLLQKHFDASNSEPRAQGPRSDHAVQSPGTPSPPSDAPST